MTAPPDLFAGVLPFVRTAESLSFREAARRLGVSPAAVSKAVARLESAVGARLLLRTSRRVSLTPEGQQFFERCRAAVTGVEAARELLAEARRAPQGELRATASPVLGRQVATALAACASRHARLGFRLHLTDRLVRLADEGFDLAVRVGPLEGSALKARRLRGTRWVTSAAPAYLARAGTPQRPADLERHECLRFLAPNGRPREWTFRSGPPRPPVRGRLLADQGEAVVAAAVAGLGLCQAFDFMVEAELRAGRLLEVLADHAPPGPDLFAVWLPGRGGHPGVRAAVEELAQAFAR